MFAYIPARIGSKRVPKKNIRIVDDKPIICHVIESLQQVKCLKGIAVSTDSHEIQSIVEQYDKVNCLELRPHSLSDDNATFMDLIRYDIPRFSEFYKTSNVLFSLATSALVKPEHYEEAVTKFKQNTNSLVLSTTEYNMSPFLALTHGLDGLAPLFPNEYLKPTKNLSACFCDCGCFYIFNILSTLEVNKLIDINPIQHVVLPQNIGIDVDTEDDFQFLSEQFKPLKT